MFEQWRHSCCCCCLLLSHTAHSCWIHKGYQPLCSLSGVVVLVFIHNSCCVGFSIINIAIDNEMPRMSWWVGDVAAAMRCSRLSVHAVCCSMDTNIPGVNIVEAGCPFRSISVCLGPVASSNPSQCAPSLATVQRVHGRCGRAISGYVWNCFARAVSARRLTQAANAKPTGDICITCCSPEQGT